MLLTDLFANAVARFPDRPAVDVPPGRDRASRSVVSYAQLARMSGAIARELAASITTESTVVVLLPRTSAWLYAAQIGVLQAGGAHVCLDVAFPAAHLAHVVRDAKAVAIVTDAAGAARCRGLGVPVVEVPRAESDGGEPPPRRPWASPASLAYVIYTSGTTGMPKGVLIEHRGVVSLIAGGAERFGLRPGDRIAQGSSPAYDSSVEETWLALASGATVVVLDDEAVRLGPDLVPWLRRERITVFCPPPTQLRAMDIASPRRQLPDLRLCYVGGEALPQDLADRWGAELWLENGYGPTECTVTVVRGRVHPQQPVTIGEPVPPHTAWLLDEQLRPVRDGEAGELCIAGPGLARGYLGQPELTAQRFPTLPGIGRVYRTGDLVVRGTDGRLSCLGRIDAQVKVRGYRIELEAIEAVLAGCAGVREVACCAQEEGVERALAAHVVPADAGAPPPFAELATAVRRSLPDYMVPKHFAITAALPRSIGGKIDRKRLPHIASVSSNGVGWHPANAFETAMRDGFAEVLRVAPAAIAADSDFFALGGDSLRAAMLVSRLRRHPGCDAVAVRDVYERRTPQALARGLGAAPATAGVVRETTRPLPPVPWGLLAVQVAFLAALLGGVSGLAWFTAFVVLPWLATTFTLAQLVLVGPWLAALGHAVYTGVSLWCAVAAKELLIGRYRAMRVSAWSGFFLRHWIVVRLVRLVPWRLLEGTEAQSTALRALGARIGKRVHLHRGVDLLHGGWDLLELADDVTLLREADLGLCEFDDGELVIGKVRIGRGATLMTRAGVGPGVEIGDGAVLEPLAFVPAGERVPAGEAWGAVPARRTGVAPARAELDVDSAELAPWLYTVLLLGARMLWAPLVTLPVMALLWCVLTWLGIDGATVVAWLCGEGPSSRPAWVWATVVFAVLALPVSLVAQALALRLTPRVPAGTHARWSWLHLRLQVRRDLLETAGGWLAGTLFWPAWLRLAGMRVGRDCEISTILDVLPEHVSVGAGTFLADGIYLGVPQHHQGRVTVAACALGERTFVGNHAVIAGGQQLPDQIVLGVCTVADDQRMRRDSGWFGLPAFELPKREVVTIDPRLTHAPDRLRYANRVFWEALRFAVPALPVWLGFWWLDFTGVLPADDVAAGMARAAVATFTCGVVLLAVVIALKWLLLGRVRPAHHGLWSCWASRWDFHYVIWERYGRALLQQLEGTLLLPWFLRAIGMRIGRRCLLGPGFAQIVDPDMLEFGDGSTVHAMFQAHSFEDRVLKIDHVRIGAGATVARASVVLYGADIRERAHVMPHSVVMKRELLLAGRDYAGAPTGEIAHREPPPVPPAPYDEPRAGREVAFDVARGFAVLGVLWALCMPRPAAGTVGWLADLLRCGSDTLTGGSAAVFFVLAGIAWANAGRREGIDRVALRASWVVRRTLGLAAIGVGLGLLRPDEPLLPFAFTLPFVAALLRCPLGVRAVALLAVLVAVPFATQAFGPRGAAVAGTVAANWRGLLFDGSHALLPWLALPLLGATLALHGANDASRWRRWTWLAAVAVAFALVANEIAGGLAAQLGALTPHLAVTRQPTSLPFVLRHGGLAVAIIGVLAWRSQRRGLGRWCLPFAALGRASLTCYVAGVLLVHGAMRWWWPQQDWGFGIGLAAAGAAAASALVASSWWFRRARRGPLEGVLAAAAGPAR